MRQPVYLHTDKTLVQPRLGLTSLHVSQINDVDLDKLACWLIDEDEPEAIKNLLATIRRHPCPAIYLRGVVLLTDMNIDANDPSQQRVDICHKRQLFDESMVDEMCTAFSGLNQWLDNIPKADEHADINLSFKVLRFIVSRKVEMLPVMSAGAHCGYDYPLLSPMFEKNDEGLLDSLDFLEQQKLLLPRFFTKTHLCSHCNSAFLNFKEICPHCSAEEIKADELIHHFKCAYTGEFSEFSLQGKLQCPKCDLPLHHIGVDYDKPSIVFRCAQCEHAFQEPHIISTCFCCQRSSQPEDQISKVINAYNATAIGKNAAIFGLDSLFNNILRSKLQLFTQTAFSDFLNIEISRSVRYKITNSSLLILQFPDLEKLHLRLGRRAEEVFIELSAIFTAILRQSDVISARNESIFFMILTETALPEAQLVSERLTAAIKQLFESNLDYSPLITPKLIKIDEHLQLDKVLEGFLEENVS